MDRDVMMDLAEYLGEKIQLAGEQVEHAAQMQAAATFLTSAEDPRSVGAWQEAIEKAVDLSDGLAAERARRQLALSERLRAQREEHKRQNAVREARLKEVEERLKRPEGLTDTPCDGCPSLGELLEEEKRDLMSELYG